MNSLLAILLTLASLACQAATVAQDSSSGASVHSRRHDGTHSQLSVLHGENALVLVVGAEDATAILNGKPVPAERIVRDGDKLTVLDEDGEIVFDVRVLDGGGLAYPYEGSERVLISRSNTSYDVARELALATTGRRKLIGVTTTSVDGVLADQLGLERDSALVINSVSKGKPADLGGLMVNDIVVAVEGERPASTRLLRDQISEREAGDELHLSILRRGEPMELTLVLQEPETGNYSVQTVGPDAIWSTAGPGAADAERAYFSAMTNIATDTQRAALLEVERELAEVRVQLEARMADLRDAEAEGGATSDLETRKSAVSQLKEAMDSLHDVSSVLRAKALASNRQVGIVSSGSGDSRVMYLPRNEVIEVEPPAIGSASSDLADRLERMEERMHRLEELLQQLIESGDGR